MALQTLHKAGAVCWGVDVETAIRSRRTHKAFGPEALAREEILALLELARWAPNHHLTAPWRFRVVGPATLERLKRAAGPEGAAKLDRAPTLIVVSCALGGTPSKTRRTCTRPRRLLHRPARRPCPWPRRLLAHAGVPALRARARRRRPARLRALRRPPASRTAAPEKEPPERPPSSRRPFPRLMLSRAAASRRSPARVRGRRDRRRHHRRRGRPRRRFARLLGGAAGARRLRRRDVEPLLEDGPRRPALPADPDLGLVREALLERQLMVQLAPHLVYPTPSSSPSSPTSAAPAALASASTCTT